MDSIKNVLYWLIANSLGGVNRGRIIEEIPLPIFGLMTDMHMEPLVKKSRNIIEIAKDLGFPFDDPLLTIATLTGAAIPLSRYARKGWLI